MSVRHALLIFPLLSALLGAAGCSVFDEGSGVPVDRVRLVADMTDQLHRGAEHRYQAEYQLHHGAAGVIAQQISPSRVSFGYPGGRLIISTTEQTSCVVTPTGFHCQLTLVPASGPTLTSYSELTKRGLMTAPILAELLAIAGRQPQADVRPFDATIVGKHSTCLEVSGLAEVSTSAFVACVTADGVLASFTGVVSGASIEQALVRVVAKVPTEPFELPAGARVVDHRASAAGSSAKPAPRRT